jgi:hypothetical protein
MMEKFKAIRRHRFLNFALKFSMFGILFQFAAMAELVDALDSGSSRGNLVDVRVILAAMNLSVKYPMKSSRLWVSDF